MALRKVRHRSRERREPSSLPLRCASREGDEIVQPLLQMFVAEISGGCFDDARERRGEKVHFRRLATFADDQLIAESTARRDGKDAVDTRCIRSAIANG